MAQESVAGQQCRRAGFTGVLRPASPHMREAEFALADAEEVFDVPAGERDPQQSVQQCVGRAFDTKYFVSPVAGL